MSLMTAEEKGKCSTVFRGGDTKASLYSWEWEQEVCRLILNTSLILACKHPFITHECDRETTRQCECGGVVCQQSWLVWLVWWTSDSMLRPVGRKAVCLLTHFKFFYCCTFSLHFNSFDHENSVFCLIHKEKKLLPCLILLFLESVPSYCSSLWYSVSLCNTIFIALWCCFFIRWQQNYPGHQLTFTVTRLL